MHAEFLGGYSVFDADGHPVSAISAQPRRLALLAYILLAERGRVGRSQLAYTFWPDCRERRARQNLSQALYFLRRHLPGALVSQGDEVTVDRSSLTCDVYELEARLGRGRLADAVTAYRGPLLHGLPDVASPTFENWLEQMRGDLRRRIRDASLSLASMAEESATPAEAAYWYERATELDGWTEPAVRSFMSALVRLGDPVSAIAAYERLRRTLASNFDEEPSPQTSALERTIRDDLAASSVTDQEFAMITQQIDDYNNCIAEKRWDDAARHLAEEVVYLPPGEPPVVGRAAVLAWLKERPPVADFQGVLTTMSRRESLAWAHGILRVSAHVDGRVVTMTGKYTNTVLRQDDGSWLCTSVTWNTDGPGPIV